MKRRAVRPFKLAWPGEQQQLVREQGVGQANGRKKASSNKKKKTVVSNRENKLFTDLYAPETTAELCVQPKKVREVQEWIQDCLDMRSPSRLLILVGSPGMGKSTMCRVLASAMGLNILQWNEVQSASLSLSTDGQMQYAQSQISSFVEFLNSASSFQALNTCTSTSSNNGIKCDNNHDRSADDLKGAGGALVLIEEIPLLYSVKAEAHFRELMGDFIIRAIYPTIMIFSDVSEGKVVPAHLEKFIDSTILYSEKVNVVEIKSVTKAKMTKCLERIANKEEKRLPKLFAEEVHDSNGGDMRNAIMALQFALTSTNGSRLPGRKGNKEAHHMDTKLSSFHALGKLLYAKRSKALAESVPVGNNRDDRPPLQFVPEDVMQQSEMSADRSLSFLAYHSPTFFLDETDLSEAFSLFSDAAVFLDKVIDPQRDRGDSIFPSEYACSIASRSVANSNRNPAPTSFRPFSSPKVFEVMRKRRENEDRMQALWKRLSVGSNMLQISSNIGSSKSLAMHDIAYMSTIIPDEVNLALSNLHSYVSTVDSKLLNDNECEELSAKTWMKEQNEVLASDDIVEEDGDD